VDDLALPYEWLGALALGILWVNAFLIAAAAMKQRGELGGVRAQLAKGSLVAGTVEEGRGEGGVLAVRRVEQIGRAMTVPGPDRILFTDRAASAESLGGKVRTDAGETIDVDARREGVEVWIDDGAPARRDGPAFEVAWSRASTNKGLVANVEQTIVEGARVWIHRGGTVLRIASMDPIALCDRKRSLLLSFALADLALCAGVTALACWPPVFGVASTIGGVLAVAYFLGVQPLGTAVRDAAKLPPLRPVGGIWQR
jgi:hypothetical protein